MTRFVRFNVVGGIGFVVQLTSLVALSRLGLPIALATLLAVEAAVLHNFLWHERWTWAGTTCGTTAGRLARFHVSNGLISVLGNIALTMTFVDAGLPLILANVTAVVACSILNFMAAHWWVFCAKTWPTFHGHLQ